MLPILEEHLLQGILFSDTPRATGDKTLETDHLQLVQGRNKMKELASVSRDAAAPEERDREK